MVGRRLRTGRRLYGGNNSFSPSESLDVAPIQMAEHPRDGARTVRAELLAASDTDQRLYGVCPRLAKGDHST